MMNEAPLLQAKIDNNVKKYWLVLTLIICVFTVFSILLLPLILPIAIIAINKHLKALSVELYERKLSVKKGIFTKIEKSVPLEKITDISMVQGPLMRVFGLYSLNVETAGQSGPGALVSVLGIIDAAEFREKVLEQKDAIAGISQNVDPSSTENDPLVTSVQNIEALLRKLVESKSE